MRPSRHPNTTLAGIVALCAMAWTPAAAQSTSIAGHWEGAIVRSNSAQGVIIDLASDAATLRGTFDIPELGLYGEALTQIVSDPPRLEFAFLYGHFVMQVHEDVGEMTGSNPEWGPPVDLHLKRAVAPPPSVVKEELRFHNGAVMLAGTLVSPATPGPHPAVVVIHGSGAQGRAQWEYRGLGEFFATHGVAALVYDKRGVGASTGDTEAATFADLAADVRAAVTLLAHRRDIDRKRIGLFGTSQGGWIAPLAASHDARVAFLILNMGAAVTVQQQEEDRVEFRMRADGFNEADVAEALGYTRQVFGVADSGTGLDALVGRAAEIEAKKWAEYVGIVKSERDVEGWRLQRYDPEPVLRATRLPILALFGENDPYVPPAKNREPMQRYLAAAGNRDVTVQVLPRLGHGAFFGSQLREHRWDWPDGYWVWDRRSPQWEQAIVEWMGPRLGPRSAATSRAGD